MPKPSPRLTWLPATDQAEAGGFGVAIVLDHEDGGEVVDLGEVVALEGGALVRGPVAHEGDGDPAGLQRLGGQRRTADQGRAAADDAVGPHHALGEVGDVHRAALAAAQAFLLAEDLGHHRLLVAALGDAVAVPAMRAGDVVAVLEVHAEADARGLLARIEMDEARDGAGRELLVHGVLELADHPHPPVGLRAGPRD